MARIYSLDIHHYRGLQEFHQVFNGENLVVLIGRGDSGKSTILDAISAVLSPHWNKCFSDVDFHHMDTSQDIIIETVLLDLPNALITDGKFGVYCSFLKDGVIYTDIQDQRAADGTMVLTIRLTVPNTLEPKWEVVSNRLEQEPVEISASDRARLNMFYVSDYIDNHFTYSKTSPLYNLFKRKLVQGDAIERKIVDVVRSVHKLAVENQAFEEFDEAVRGIRDDAVSLGLDLTDLKTLLEYKENAFTQSNISLHDGDIPYRMHGKGAKRLLSFAIQKALASVGGIILVDEIEQGLEPDRIVNLVRYFKTIQQGQVFVTTHSSHALCEANYNNLFLMRKGEPQMQVFSEDSQPILRTQPCVFFSKKVICCEGKTEEGFLRGIDAYIRDKAIGFSSLGVNSANGGGGDKFYKQAEALFSVGYDVCIMADNDVEVLRKNNEAAKDKGISIFVCEDGKCLETQIFSDMPWQAISELVKYGETHTTKHNVWENLDVGSCAELVATIEVAKQEQYRTILGLNAKKQSWYKNFEGGEFLASTVLKHLNTICQNTRLYQNMANLKNWIIT